MKETVRLAPVDCDDLDWLRDAFEADGSSLGSSEPARRAGKGLLAGQDLPTVSQGTDPRCLVDALAAIVTPAASGLSNMEANADLWGKAVGGAVFGEGTLNVNGAFNR